jgi:hypothetical protein
MTVPLFITFCVLTAATLALALGRLILIRFKADECLHLVDSDVPLIEQQKVSARRLETVDVWGKTLTVLAILAGISAYCAWWIGA